MANTIKADNGSEIYQNEINRLADEYIQQELKINPDDIKDSDNRKMIIDNFPDLIFYIADRIQKPSHDDITLLDDIFSTYERLCCRHGVLPTLEGFSNLVSINRATFSDWANGEYRKDTGHGNAVKRWRAACKAQLVNSLHQGAGANVNRIFIAKSCYGMRETSPLPLETTDSNRPVLSQDEIHQIAEQASQTSVQELLEELPDE